MKYQRVSEANDIDIATEKRLEDVYHVFVSISINNEAKISLKKEDSFLFMH